MDESIRGETNGIQPKRIRPKATLNKQHRLAAIRKASVLMGATTWAGMFTSGA